MSEKAVKPLNTKQQVFVSEYLKCFNGTDAYLKAYPKVKHDSARAAAARLLAEVSVKAEIESRLSALHMGADEFFMDTYILPGASDFDRAYVRDAVQATGYFGRAWTTRPAMLADTARSFGTARPPALGGLAGRRR